MSKTSLPVPAKAESQRALARVARRERREGKAERREAVFGLVVSGYGYDEIARRSGISVSAVRRIVDQTLTERQTDAPQRYIGLQIARLSKALQVTDLALESGDLRSVPMHIEVMRELDRYHGLAARLVREDTAKTGGGEPAVALESGRAKIS